MLNKNKMKNKPQRTQTLADKIAGVLSATPKSFDPEDEPEETSAKVTDQADDGGDDSDVEELLSKFRTQNIKLLEDVDMRYAGKKGSRKALKDDIDSEDGDDYADIDDADDDDDEESVTSGEETDDDDVEIADETDTNFKHLITPDQSTQKGTCVKNQLNIWENLLEMRIQLQKCLIASNKLPQFDAYQAFKQSPEFQKKTVEVTKSVGNMLSKMIDLQTLCINKYPETKKVLKNETCAVENDDGDEEIPSDTDNENLSDEDEIERKQPKKKKFKLSDYEAEIEKVHKSYAPARNSIIQKWNDKTRIASGVKTAGHSVLNQIEHALSDQDKLIKRTQLKRSVYQIYAKPENSEEYDAEIFDDDDFYHQLLRELIEVKSADLTDPVQLGRQWMQLQNLRSKLKRKIDTKATKGRKIRYAVHSKLVNFMAPVGEDKWTDEAKTELFSSLFGQVNKSS